MANKVDVRVLKTKQKLQQALVELLKDNRIEDISISEICTTGEVNRNTFYAHYSDVFALFDDVKEVYYQYFISEIGKMKTSGENTQRIITYFLQSLETNRKLFASLFADRMGLGYLKQVVENCLSDALRAINVNTQLVTTKDFSLFIIGGVTNLIEEWLNDENYIDPKDMGAKVSFFIYNIKTNYV